MPDWRPGVTITKDPDAVLDYRFDWSAWLAGDTISTFDVEVPSGLTLQDDSLNTPTNTIVTVWLAGGAAGATYEVRCRVTTAAGRTDDRTVRIAIASR